MLVPRSVRLVCLVTIELARKYTRFLIVGFFVGLFLSLVFWKAYPFITTTVFRPLIRIGMVGEVSPSALPSAIQELVSLGLTKLTPDGTAVPALAESWEATNSGKTFIFTLRNDFSWHTGKTADAHDVNYNIRGVTFVPTGDRTLIAYLQYPYSPFPTLVSKPVFLPGLNGIGSYMIGSIRLQGERIKSLLLHPAGKSNNASRRYTFYQTEAQALLAYKLGEIDEIADMSTISGMDAWGNTHIEERVKYDRIVSLFFNMRNQELNEKSVRHGLAYGVPVLPFERAESPIAKTSWAYTDNVRSFHSNPAEAKKLLEGSALATGSGELTLSTFPAYLDIAQHIASAWTDLGIRTKVQVEASLPSNYQVLLSAHDVPPDPDQYPFWHSTQTSTNITGYVNVKIDKLLEDGRQELDQDKRKILYTDFQRRLVEEAPVIFLYYPTLYTIKRGK